MMILIQAIRNGSKKKNEEFHQKWSWFDLFEFIVKNK